jgi:superfamily I DNA/RNA helicase
MLQFTPEQHDVMDHMMDPEQTGITLVGAGAGTGKSFLAKQVTKALSPKRGLYTAFNKAIVEEGNARFEGTNMLCKTFHALAYKYVQPTQEIEELSYTCIEEDLTYGVKYRLIQGINHFFVSASTDMYDFMEQIFSEEEDPELMVNLATRYIDLMVQGKVNPSFNFLLKYFHLMLVEETITVEFDLVILDEINDTTAVALEIFKLIKAPKKLGLGETNQAIYDFLHLVDGFELLEGQAEYFPLTQSFRCSEKIASDIQYFMRADVSEKFTFVGTNEPVANGKTLVCTMTNAMIIKEIYQRMSLNKGFYLLRKVSEIFSYPLAIVSAGQGKAVYQKKYKHLEKEFKNWQKDRARNKGSYLQYLSEHLDDPETKNAVNLLMMLSKQNINIFDLYKRAKEADTDFNYTIATVFTSKGLEFETVILADDLNTRIQSIRDKGGIEDHKDLVDYRCYYVAASRAGKELLNATALQKPSRRQRR